MSLSSADDQLRKGPPPSILDRELRTPASDAFGHNDFVDQLAGYIEKHEPPYSVGLIGKRGIGKSTVKALYEARLEDRPSMRHIRALTFNAWRYGSENIKRALLRHLYVELGGDKTKLDDALYRQIQQTAVAPGGWKQRLEDLGGFALEFFGPLVVFALLVVGFVRVLTDVFAPDETQALAWIGSAAVAALTLLGRHILLFNQSRTKRAPLIKIDQPVSATEQYEDLLVDQLAVYKRRNRGVERLVVFVDDLDRLGAEDMVQGIEAVQAFMELPPEKIGGLGIIFVLSCDAEKIAEALYSRARRHDLDLPATVNSLSDARHFLQRVFKQRVEIPPLPRQDMRSFVRAKLEQEMRPLVSALAARETGLPTVVERLIHVGVQDPRNALTLLNTFADSYWLAAKREALDGTDRPGGLSEGSVTGHPDALAALTALRIDFPDFYADLQRDPNLIRHFETVFLRRQGLGGVPEFSRNLLQKYGTVAEDEATVAAEHRTLGRLVASFEGLRWPPSLQPLLLLSQDPVTRSLGDEATAVYDDLVSNNVEGVLRGLGRDLDQEELGPDQVALLRAMLEQLHLENPVRQDNAYAVVARLFDRLPPEHARDLVSKLARRLASSRELRTRVGFPALQQVAKRALKADRGDLVDALAADLLRVDEPINFLTRSGQTPSLEEARSLVSAAAETVLWTLEQDGLSIGTSARLARWLEARPYRAGDDEASFSFGALEGWMQAFPSLLSLLGEQYTGWLAAELRLEDPDISDVGAALARSRRVFDRLLEQGEEGRETLWRQLSDMVRTHVREARAFAYTYMDQHQERVGDEALASFLASFSVPLYEPNEDDLPALEVLARLSERRPEAAGEAARDIVEVATHAGHLEPIAPLATRLATVLLGEGAQKVDMLVENWTQSLFDGLPLQGVVWLGEHFPNFSSERRQRLSSHLTQTLDPGRVKATVKRPYTAFVRKLPAEALNDDLFRHHATQVFTYFGNSNIRTWDVFRETAFPVVPVLMGATTPSQLGSSLQNYFNHLSADIAKLGWSHHIMIDAWPKQSAETSGYQPDALFETAYQRASAAPAGDGAASVLLSLDNMVQRGVVTKDKEPRVEVLSLALWPYHRQKALGVLVARDTPLTVAQLAGLAEPINWSDAADVARLETLWKKQAGLLGQGQLEVARVLLRKQALGTTERPDAAFRTWLKVQPLDPKKALLTLLAEASLGGEARQRVYAHALERLNLFEEEAIAELVRMALSAPDQTATVDYVLDNTARVTGELPTQKGKNAVAESILGVVDKVDSHAAVQKLSRWLKDLKATQKVKRFAKQNALKDSVRRVLAETFNF